MSKIPPKEMRWVPPHVFGFCGARVDVPGYWEEVPSKAVQDFLHKLRAEGLLPDENGHFERTRAALRTEPPK